MKSINKRIDPNISISEDLFSSGLIDVTDFLSLVLTEFLEKEERYVGIVKSYINSMNTAYEKFNLDLCDEDSEIYGKILYLLKPIITKEFYRLRSKKLIDGDCVILIIRRILDIVLENADYTHKKVAKTLSKIVNSLFNNIRNRNKKDAMYVFSNSIKNLKHSGSVGKYSIDSLELGNDKEEKVVYQGDGLLIENDSDNKISEKNLWIEDK